MEWIKKLFKKKPQHEIIDRRYVLYSEGDRLIKESVEKPIEEQWVLDTELEDTNRSFLKVYLCRKKQLTTNK